MGGFFSEHETRENVSKKPSHQMFESKSYKRKNIWKIDKKLSRSEILHLHGTIEVQVHEGEEVDLRKQIDCIKNPGHPQFISIKDFTMEHLPKGYNDTDLYDWINSIADLTVRVDVRMASPHRPKYWPKTNSLYPFYKKSEEVTMTTGSGEIFVYTFEDGQGYDGLGRRDYFLTGENIESECPCDNCIDSDKPNNVWWEIYVATATHVVFDEIEASHTSCKLFYDSKDSPAVTLKKFSLVHVDIEKDRCAMKYVTCKDIGKQLYEKNVHKCKLWRIVWFKYWSRSDVIFIVSHPHGGFKKVSVGHLIDNYKVRKFNKWDITKLTYTTGTCPGSSGASIHLVGSASSHVHAGCEEGLNHSSIGYYMSK